MNSRNFEQSQIFIKKSFFNCFWVFQNQLDKIGFCGEFDTKIKQNKYKKIKKTIKYMIVIILNFFVGFLSESNLEQVNKTPLTSQ